MLCLRNWNFTILALENTDNIELQEILGLGRFGPHSKLCRSTPFSQLNKYDIYNCQAHHWFYELVLGIYGVLCSLSKHLTTVNYLSCLTSLRGRTGILFCPEPGERWRLRGGIPAVTRVKRKGDQMAPAWTQRVLWWRKSCWWYRTEASLAGIWVKMECKGHFWKPTIR